MHYLRLLILIFTLSYGDDFDRLNSSPTPQMLLNQKNAKVCKHPAPAKENMDSDFKYGCFCGKRYPNIRSSTGKSYRKLNREEKDKLIEKYYAIKPYDDIDALCMQHDICYIYTGREDQTCNDFLYNALKELSARFYEQAKKEGRKSKAKRCDKLASDIGVVFKTILASRENLSMMRFGLFMMVNTPMTVVSKGIQKGAHGMNDSSTYPLPNEKCGF